MSLTMALIAALVAPQQTPPATPAQDPAVAVDDIIVDGRSTDDRAQDFVSEVAAPPFNRNLATWRSEVCVTAVNMPQAHGQALVDRVSQVALHLGVRVGEPGCDPNVVIAMATEAQTMAAQLVEQHRRTFRPGWTGAARTSEDLDSFVQSTAPVRWWHISIPVDAATGAVAVRLPTDGEDVRQVAKLGGASRLRSALRDDMRKAFVIIDVDDVANVSFEQLSDYVAFLVLAQTDPDADTAGHDTILNLFKGAPQPGLTPWDLAYLEALYASDTTSTIPGRHGNVVAHDLARTLNREGRAADREAAADSSH